MLMTVNKQTYLPTVTRTTLTFMQKVTRGQKLTIQKHQKPELNIPTWPELSIRNIWPHACRINNFLMYMPDDWSATKKTERKFFFNILTFLAPNFVQDLIRESRRLRHAHAEQRLEAPRPIEMTHEWADAILGEPYRSGKSTPFALITIFP